MSFKNMSQDDILMHYGRSKMDGAPVGSGRYPLGSGDTPYERAKDFRSSISDLKSKGLTEKDIADAKGMTIKELRARIAIAKDVVIENDASQVMKLHEKGMSNVAIADKLGVSEGTVRNYLKNNGKVKLSAVSSLVSALKDEVANKGYVDVGLGTEKWLGVSQDKLNSALVALQDEGYVKQNIKEYAQSGTGNTITITVLAKPGETLESISKNREKIRPAGIYTEDNGDTYRRVEKPKPLSSKRVKIRYAEDGGVEKDGVIELRRGVDDISLHNAKYAQVRINVDDTHYLKGMAVYGDARSFPKGIDVIFNTNKKKGTPMLGPKDHSVLKPLEKDKETGEIDWKNPFKASVKLDDELIRAQRHYIDKNGKEQLSCLNIVNEEGNWSKWSRNLASQFLSKQSVPLAKRQLNLAYAEKLDEYEEISSLTNPVIKKKLLLEFADNCDSAAVHLKAAPMPRQITHVILPIPEMNSNECYAPNYDTGEQLALVRYPHAGTFEIPIVKVNNNNVAAKKIMKQASDAIGINSKVAERLSGADFDGDTVIAIPLKGQKIISTPALKGLEGFDPKAAYPHYDGMTRMSPKKKQQEMGIVSNLITDMNLKGAHPDEMARAVRHSMVVIDAEKHYLNWQKSYKDNKIGELKKLYQSGGGASTLISRAKSTEYVNQRKPARKTDSVINGIDINTGEKVFEDTGKTRWDKKTQTYVPKLQKSTKMYEAKDANALLSEHGGTEMERVYASYANKLKNLANTARKEWVDTKNPKMNVSAKKVYAQELKDLSEKLITAQKNKPLERQAQLLAAYNVRLRKQNNPELKDDKDRLKKITAQELSLSRRRVGAKKELIQITDREWEAIQAGAVSANQLEAILANTDVDALKERAMPRRTTVVPPAKQSRAKAMYGSGMTQADIAKALGVSVSTVSKIVNS